MGQRRQIARGAQRTLLVNHGVQARVEKTDQVVHQVGSYAGVPVTKALDLEQQHQPDDPARRFLPCAAGMRPDEVALQGFQLGRRYDDVLQSAESRIDAVVIFGAGEQAAIQEQPAILEPLAGGIRQRQLAAFVKDAADIFKPEIVRSDQVCFGHVPVEFGQVSKSVLPFSYRTGIAGFQIKNRLPFDPMPQRWDVNIKCPKSS